MVVNVFSAHSLSFVKFPTDCSSSMKSKFSSDACFHTFATIHLSVSFSNFMNSRLCWTSASWTVWILGIIYILVIDTKNPNFASDEWEWDSCPFWAACDALMLIVFLPFAIDVQSDIIDYLHRERIVWYDDVWCSNTVDINVECEVCRSLLFIIFSSDRSFCLLIFENDVFVDCLVVFSDFCISSFIIDMNQNFTLRTTNMTQLNKLILIFFNFNVLFFEFNQSIFIVDMKIDYIDFSTNIFIFVKLDSFLHLYFYSWLRWIWLQWLSGEWYIERNIRLYPIRI